MHRNISRIKKNLFVTILCIALLHIFNINFTIIGFVKIYEHKIYLVWNNVLILQIIYTSKFGHFEEFDYIFLLLETQKIP